MTERITVYLRAKDADIKGMLAELGRTEAAGNPYVDRSESEICRMLLVEAVKRQHKRYCAQQRLGGGPQEPNHDVG